VCVCSQKLRLPVLFCRAPKLRQTIKTNFLHKIKLKPLSKQKRESHKRISPVPLANTTPKVIYSKGGEICAPTAKTAHFYESARCVRVCFALKNTACRNCGATNTNKRPSLCELAQRILPSLIIFCFCLSIPFAVGE